MLFVELYSEDLMTSTVIGLFFRFCFRLRQSSFHWIISDGVTSGIGRKWKRSDSSDSDSVELMTPLTTPIFDFHLVLRTFASKSSYGEIFFISPLELVDKVLTPKMEKKWGSSTLFRRKWQRKNALISINR